MVSEYKNTVRRGIIIKFILMSLFILAIILVLIINSFSKKELKNKEEDFFSLIETMNSEEYNIYTIKNGKNIYYSKEQENQIFRILQNIDRNSRVSSHYYQNEYKISIEKKDASDKWIFSIGKDNNTTSVRIISENEAWFMYYSEDEHDLF